SAVCTKSRTTARSAPISTVGKLTPMCITLLLYVCCIHPLPVLQGCPWERHAPAWLWSRARARRSQEEGTDAGLTPWTSLLHTLTHEIGHALRNHNGRGVGIGPNHIRHDRGVGDAQPGEPMHPAVLVYHCQGV